jgi:hypothetical protein
MQKFRRRFVKQNGSGEPSALSRQNCCFISAFSRFV